MAIDRPSWGDGERTVFTNDPSKAIVPVTENRALAPSDLANEMEAWEPGSVAVTDPREQRAEFAVDNILDDEPALDNLPWEDLPEDVRGAIRSALADHGHLRDGDRLIRKVYDKLTGHQALALDDWLCELPDELLGGGDE